MTPRQRTALALSLFVLLLAFAYSPLLQAGLTAPDYGALITGTSEPATGPDPGVEGGLDSGAEGGLLEKPLAKGSLLLSRRLWGLPPSGSHGGGPALFLRLENLLLHLLAAVGLGLYARRLLLPWSGSEQARAAAYSSTVFFALYPLATPAVAGMASRGDLLGMAFGAWSAFLFLRGRQDRKLPFTAVSLAFCILGGFASDLVLGLPLLLCGSDFLSAHRYRPLRVRLRTAASTLLIFGAGVGIDTALHVWRLGSGAVPPGLRALAEVASGEDVSRQLLVAIEKLGLLVLPANPEVLGIAGWALAGTLFLLAMQPALVAARSAPRLWGWLLFAWFAALATSELFHAHVRVTPHELSHARALLPSAAVMAIGLSLGATALSGPKRPYVAWVVALGYACLAHANALPWRNAAIEVTGLREELAMTLETYGRDARVLVLDLPQPSGGVDPVGEALPWLAHAELDGRVPTSATPLPRVRGLSTAAFLMLVGEPEFADMRASAGDPSQLVVVYPVDVADGSVAGAGRAHWVVSAPQSAESPQRWNATLQSPPLNLDPLLFGALIVTASPEADVEALGIVSWSRGSLAGTWIDTGGELTGVFDLSASLAWRESGTVQRMLFKKGTGSIGRAVPAADPPTLGELAPAPRDDDWVFPLPDVPLTEATAGRARYVLSLLELSSLKRHELNVAVRNDELVAHGAARLAAETIERGDGPLVWILDYRIDGRVVARARGRRQVE